MQKKRKKAAKRWNIYRHTHTRERKRERKRNLTIIRKQCFKHHPHRTRFLSPFCSVDFKHFTMAFVVYTEHNAEEQITLSECIMHVHRTNNPWKMLVRPLLTQCEALQHSITRWTRWGKCTRCWRSHYMATRAYWIFLRMCWAQFHRKLIHLPYCDAITKFLIK